MDIPLLIVAVVLTAIGVDILRFPKQPPPTLRQDDEATFGKGVELPYERRRFYIWRGMYGAAARTPEVRALAFVLVVAGVTLGAKGLGII
jgi:hypothetical protein